MFLCIDFWCVVVCLCWFGWCGSDRRKHVPVTLINRIATWGGKEVKFEHLNQHSYKSWWACKTARNEIGNPLLIRPITTLHFPSKDANKTLMVSDYALPKVHTSFFIYLRFAYHSSVSKTRIHRKQTKQNHKEMRRQPSVRRTRLNNKETGWWNGINVKIGKLHKGGANLLFGLDKI